jgi:tetratricopeptide (TPR) repeat protein
MMPDRGEQEREVMRELAGAFLKQLPEQVRRVVRLGAIPRSFSARLLIEMAGPEANVPRILETLEEYHFLDHLDDDWYSYERQVREALIATWDDPGMLEDFHEANRKALTYFRNLARSASAPDSYAYEREVLFHLLLDNEKEGLDHLAYWFEQACDQYEFGLAQDFTGSLQEALPRLSALSREHHLYYEGRLDFLLEWRPGLAERLASVSSSIIDPLIKARMGILIGQAWLRQFEWSESARTLKSSLAELNRLKDNRYVARAMLVLGEVYENLVENSGGLQPERRETWGWLNRLLHLVFFLPYVVLDWFRRNLRFSPSWFVFGGSYQVWVLNYLLRRAGSWYARAAKSARESADEITVVAALFAQGRVAIGQQRVARAKHIFQELAGLPLVQASRYRSALVLNGFGQISSMKGSASQAKKQLTEALRTFRAFGDTGAAAQAAANLGQVCRQQEGHEASAQAYLESLKAFGLAEQPFSQTLVYWNLADLLAGGRLSEGLRKQVEEALELVPERQYLVRFPDDLLQRFRRLAYLIAIPVSYILILFIGLAAGVTLLLVESFSLQSAAGLSWFSVLILIALTVVPLPVACWIVELIYSVLGQIWLMLLGGRSLGLLAEQPERISLNREGLKRVQAPGRPILELALDDLRLLVSAEYRLWKRPIALLSRQFAVSKENHIPLEGVTSGYSALIQDLRGRARGAVSTLEADLVILANRWTFGVMVLALLHSALLVSLGQGAITATVPEKGCEQPLILSTLLLFFILNMLVMFPPMMLWRVYAQRRLLARHLAYQPRVLGNALLLVLAVLLTVIAGLWLVVSPVAKAGTQPAPNLCTSNLNTASGAISWPHAQHQPSSIHSIHPNRNFHPRVDHAEGVSCDISYGRHETSALADCELQRMALGSLVDPL